jgi:hypothetical protein
VNCPKKLHTTPTASHALSGVGAFLGQVPGVLLQPQMPPVGEPSG